MWILGRSISSGAEKEAQAGEDRLRLDDKLPIEDASAVLASSLISSLASRNPF